VRTTPSGADGAPCVGIGLRRPFVDDVLAEQEPAFDFLEIVPENFVHRGGRPRRVLEAVAERFDVLVHGVSLSLGGPDPFDPAYVAGLREVLDIADAATYTDHLCYATVHGFATHELLPLPFTEEAVRHAARRIRELQDRLERPVAVENITYYAVMPGSQMHGADFVRAVVEEADCGLLLDVNNTFVNARNLGEDPDAILERLPLDRTVQMHIAGHVQEGPRLLDNHGRPVADEVFALFRTALHRTGPVPVLLEWDLDIPSYARVIEEATKVRTVYREALDGSGTPA